MKKKSEMLAFQQFVEQELSILSARMKMDQKKHKVDFDSLSSMCIHNRKTPGHKKLRSCKIIKTSSLCLCRIENCPHLKNA